MNLPELGEKFKNPDITAKGDVRASVPLMKATTLWFNTGILCNIECINCYIKSSPKNDSLVYITPNEVNNYLNQIKDRKWATSEIAFTGGEPFMNPDMIQIARNCLNQGYEVLILTNAMLPMMRKSIKIGLLELLAAYGEKLTIRISLDHFTAEYHDKERGKGSYDITIKGMQWLRDNKFKMAIAGRTV
ncbi:MAG: radical SAM protein, partial [Rhodobacterales bacterium]